MFYVICSYMSLKLKGLGVFVALDETVKWFLQNYDSGARTGNKKSA